MRRKPFWLVICGLVVLLVTAIYPTHADATGPLLLVRQTGLWAWDGQNLNRVIEDNKCLYLVISPNGRYAACAYTYNEVGLDAATPSDIYIVDLATFTETLVASQPPGFILDEPSARIFRSDPSWSPDGQYLAWTEFPDNPATITTQPIRLLAYEVATKQSHVIASLPENQKFELPTQPVNWGVSGIAVWNTLENNVDEIAVYSPNGKLLSKTAIGSIYQYFWIKDKSRQYVAALGRAKTGQNFHWLLLDPLESGSAILMNGQPAFVHSISKEQRVSALPDSATDKWAVKLPGGTDTDISPFVSPQYSVDRYMSISPDGLQIAFIDSSNDAYILSGSTHIKIASNVYGLAWTASQWQLVSN